MVQAYILIQTEVGKAHDVAAAIRDIPGVVRVDAVTGPVRRGGAHRGAHRRRARQHDREQGPARPGHHPHAHLLRGAPLDHRRGADPHAGARSDAAPPASPPLVAVPIAAGHRSCSLWLHGGFCRPAPAADARPRPAAVGDRPGTAGRRRRLPDATPAGLPGGASSQLPDHAARPPRRPVTAGPEQNAAYGEPPITLACGVPAPAMSPTEPWTTVSRGLLVRRRRRQDGDGVDHGATGWYRSRFTDAQAAVRQRPGAGQRSPRRSQCGQRVRTAPTGHAGKSQAG